MPANVTKDRLTLFEERLRRRLHFPVKPGRARRICTLNTSECFENAPHFLHHPSCSRQKSARAEWMRLMGPEPKSGGVELDHQIWLHTHRVGHIGQFWDA